MSEPNTTLDIILLGLYIVQQLTCVPWRRCVSLGDVAGRGPLEGEGGRHARRRVDASDHRQAVKEG